VGASPRIGCVKYLNAQPLIYGWPGEIIFDHPAMLCRLIAAGELDVALVSSFEYLRNPIYSVIDGIAIASDGPVYSVVLAHREPLEKLREIAIDPASETSVNLLRCLLAERGLTARLVSDADLLAARARLLIGDQAIRFRREAGPEIQFLDLGADWKALTGLPFVYALWLIRADFPEKAEVAEALRSLGKANRANLDPIIAAQPEAERAFCEFYFRDCLHFSFEEQEKRGFRRFAELCARDQLIAKLPPPPALV
jgi:chorismate dehydratase